MSIPANSNLHKRHHLKLSKTKSGEYEGVCLNPKDIPPDDLDDVILGRMIKEAGVFYKMGGRTLKEHLTDSSLSV